VGNCYKVGIIVLNWNRPADTLECLDSLLPFVRQRIATIICCDNGSTDDSLKIIINWAEKIFNTVLTGSLLLDHDQYHHAPVPSFVLISSGVNRGYAGGNNVGIRYALKTRAFEYIWILNNDTVVEENTLPALIKSAETFPEIGLFGSTIVDYSDPEKIQCAGGCRYFPLLTIVKNVFQGEKLSTVLSGEKEICLDYIAGASMFIRNQVIQAIGLLNENYFLYYEEIDYAKRLRDKTSYTIGWCKESIVRHKGGVSTASRSGKDRSGSWLSNYYENISTLQYINSEYRLLLPFAAVFRLVMKLAMLVMFRRWKSFKPLIKAYRDFFCQKPPQGLNNDILLVSPKLRLLGFF